MTFFLFHNPARRIIFLGFLVALSGFDGLAQNTPERSNIHQKMATLEKTITRKKFTEAERQLQQLLDTFPVAQDSTGKSVFYLQGYLLEKKNKPREAIAKWIAGLDKVKDYPRPDLYLEFHLARLISEQNLREELPRVTPLVYDVLEKIVPTRQEDLWRLIYDQCKILLRREEVQVLEAEKKHFPANAGQMLYRAFRRQDPTPATLTNEYIVQFFRRAALAREKFGDPLNPRGYDSRGDIFILLGPTSRMFIQRTGTRGPLGYVFYPYEIWFYQHIHPDLYFTFVGRLGKSYFELADGPESILGTFYKRRRIFFNRPGDAELAYRIREDLYMFLAPLHDDFRRRLQRMQQQLTVEDALEYALQYFPDEDREHARKTREMVDRLVLGGDFTRDTLTTYFRSFAFADPNGKTRIEFVYLIPASQLKFELEPTPHSLVKTQLAVFDPDYHPIFQDSARIRVEYANERVDVISSYSLRIPPGQYKVLFRTENPPGEKESLFRTTLRVPPVSANRLALSDLVLVEAAGKEVRPGLFRRNGWGIVPYPVNSHPREYPFKLYFEIYNLASDDNGQRHYRVSWEIQGAKKGKKFFGIFGNKQPKVFLQNTIEKTSLSSLAMELLELDLNKLPLQDYLLRLKVIDLSSKQESDKTLRFTLF